MDTHDLQRQDNHVVHPWEQMKDIGQNSRTVMTRSGGIYLYDSDGKRYIDGPGGMWCVNVGHGRTEIADAIRDQALEMAYCSPFTESNGPAAILAAKLAELSPGDLNHTFFTSSGSAAVDSALRFVFYYNNVLGRPDKKHIISRHSAYHGSTYLTASAAGKAEDKVHMDTETEIIHHLSDPKTMNRPAGTSLEQWCDFLVDEFEAMISDIGEENVAAFIGEPLLASGGVSIPPPGYHRRFVEVCRRHSMLYISDEVVTGFGRLGHWFASEDVYGVVPDIVTTAKGLTSGYQPLGAVLISDRLIADLSQDEVADAGFSNGYTYSGHPVACAAALANIEIIEREQILEHAREVGPHLQARITKLADHPQVVDVRGEGLMGAIEFDASVEGLAQRVDEHCEALGLLVRPLGNSCVFSPPLIITDEQIDEMMDILEQAIELATEDLAD